MEEKDEDLGLLVGKSWRFRAGERVSFPSGMSTFDMCSEDIPSQPNFALSPASPSPIKGKGETKGRGDVI